MNLISAEGSERRPPIAPSRRPAGLLVAEHMCLLRIALLAWRKLIEFGAMLPFLLKEELAGAVSWDVGRLDLMQAAAMMYVLLQLLNCEVYKLTKANSLRKCQMQHNLLSLNISIRVFYKT